MSKVVKYMHKVGDKAFLFETYEQPLRTQIEQLKQELAEKDRQLKLAEELLIKQEKEYDEQLEKQAKIHYRHLKEKDQDKISFAVEQLEQTRKLVDELLDNCKNKQYKVWEVFDNQINGLKEGK